jgi:hypothetical protein
MSPTAPSTVSSARPPDDRLDTGPAEPGWHRPRRTNSLTTVLIAALVAVAAFGGGAAVQRWAGVASASGMRQPSGQPAGRMPGGMPGTETGEPSGRRQAASVGGSASHARPAGSEPLVLVGRVRGVLKNTITVTNLAGTIVTVSVPATATVTTSGLSALAAGHTVAVYGAKNADGTVIATSVITRAVPKAGTGADRK